MTVSSRFTALVGCDLPIELAPMSGMVTPALAAAVSDAGGLGTLAAGRRGATVMADQIAATRALTDRPFGVGFIVQFLAPDVFEVVVDQVRVIEHFWGDPDPALVPDDRVVGWQVGSVDEACAAADAGCSYVIVQGVEAGGHVRGATPLLELIPAVRDAIDLPLVASGGLGTAAHVHDALARGADAVRIGTRFVAATESDAHDRYVELLAEADDDATELTDAFGVSWPDAPHRVLASAVARAGAAPATVGHVTSADGTRADVPRFFVSPPSRAFAGDIDAMALYGGAGSVGAVRGRLPAADIIRDLWEGSA